MPKKSDTKSGCKSFEFFFLQILIIFFFTSKQVTVPMGLKVALIANVTEPVNVPIANVNANSFQMLYIHCILLMEK